MNKGNHYCTFIKTIFLIIGIFSHSFSYGAMQKDSCQDNTTFNIGAGIYDITGPAAERGMMGYAMLHQQTSGISERLWARAFVIESPCNKKRVVFVNTDLCQIFQGVKQEVMRKLKEKYGELYRDENVLITATHTHSGPGGFSTYTLYNLTTLGFSRRNFDTIVDGILNAIERAQKNMVSGEIKIARGSLTGINFNRSPQSYSANPISERSRYADLTDTEMTLLRLDAKNGKPIGIITWFPIHGVSMNNKNHLISSDNKGYAEYRFEQDFNSDYGDAAFVAAFAQANAGDVSPNEYGHEGGEGIEGIKAIEKAGEPQYEFAKKLYNEAKENLKGGIDYRHKYYQMDQITIEPQYADGKAHTTCPAAIGISMLAGTQDGEGLGVQGVNCNTITRLIPGFVCQMFITPCQGVKPIALQTGTMLPHPWTPNILPLQVLKVGNLLIAAAPFELTTMTGRRIRESINKQISNSFARYIVLSALANGYAQYVATNEEYELQRYEGASTLFGPWQSAMLKQEFSRLTQALILNETVEAGPTPPDLTKSQWNLQPGVIFDDKPIGKNFGDVYLDVKANYKPEETAQAIFWGAHPKNNFRIQDTFLAVEQFDKGKWKVIRRDRDWDTEYHWQRKGVAYSLITIVWRIPQDMPKGKYRLVHYGDAKALWNGKISSYTGYSSPFTIK